MRRPEFLARQGRCPSGWLGSFIGRIMAHETAKENAAAIELLRLEPTDRVLEVGFGHGRTIQALVSHVPEGRVSGIDHSPDMLRLATSVNRDAIAHGLVELRQGNSDQLPYADHEFHKVLTVHTVYFWPNPAAHFREFRRVLRAGGRFVLGFKSKDHTASSEFPATVYTFRSVEEIHQMLREAGFSGIEVDEAGTTARQISLVTGSV